VIVCAWLTTAAAAAALARRIRNPRKIMSRDIPLYRLTNEGIHPHFGADSTHATQPDHT
jgi:hypothetical protein